VPAASSSFALHFATAAVYLHEEPRAFVGSQSGGDAHGAVAVGPRPQVPARPQAPVAVVFVGDARGLHTAALVGELVEGHDLGGVEQLLFGGRPFRGDVGDPAD